MTVNRRAVSRAPHRAALLTALAVWACGQRSTDPVAEATLYAVNGARVAGVFPGDTVTWAGFGFGDTAGDGAVLVTAGGALTPATVVSWSDGEIRAVLPAGVESGATYVRSARDSLGPLELFVRARTPFDPAARGWVADADLPLAVAGPGAAGVRFPAGATVSAFVVLTGGLLPDSTVNRRTYIGTVSAAGRVTAWREATDTLVPAGRRLHQMVGADRTNARLSDLESVAYMLGGIDSAGRVLSDALGIGVSSDGVYSLWTPLAPLPDRRAGMAAMAAFGKIYVFGGFGSDSLAARDVAYATVLPTGTLNGWFRGPPLPEGRAFAAAALIGSTIFVLGGERGVAGIVDPDTVADTTSLTATIYAIRVSALSGAFVDTAWTELPVTLGTPRARFAAFVVDDALVAVGGVYAGMPSSAEGEFATITDGLPGTFQELPAPYLADVAGGPLWSVATPDLWTAGGAGRITLLGGRLSGVPSARTFSY